MTRKELDLLILSFPPGTEGEGHLAKSERVTGRTWGEERKEPVPSDQFQINQNHFRGERIEQKINYAPVRWGMEEGWEDGPMGCREGIKAG